MKSFTFLHVADLHLDTPFDGLRALRPALAEELREASLRAFDRLIELAVERAVAFVVFAGDVYDGAERGLRAQLRFRRGLERLSAAGIDAFVVHGNHDPVDEGWAAIASWPAKVHVFGSGEVEARPVERGGVRIATVHGISFGRRAEMENLARRFRRGPEGGIHVGLLHCNVEGQQGHDPYAPCSLDDLEAARMDYWALGHVHTRQLLSRAPRWVAYPGNLQGRSFKPAEQGPKGALLIQVEDDAVQEVEFCPLAPVVFDTVQVDISALADLGELEDALLEAADALVQGRGCEGLMLAAELHGRGPLHGLLGRQAEALRQALDDATAERRPWIRWERLIRRSSPEVDRERLAERDDLVGELLRRIDGLSRDPTKLRELMESVDATMPGRSLDSYVPALEAVDRLALLEKVELDALDRLEVES